MVVYHIVLIRPPESQMLPLAFADVISLLQHSLASLGIPCTYAENDFAPTAINLVLGYHLLPNAEPLRSMPSVVYQLEPLAGQASWIRLDDRNREILRAARAVWDYSPANVEFLAAEGLPGVRHLPLGYHESLERVPNDEPDIDVLFYGAINTRRKAVLDALKQRCRVKIVFGVYGEKRDRLIARSKVVLNMHSYSVPLMEQPRVSYLLNNRRFVVAETSLDDPYGGALLTVPYADLAETCLRYLDDAAGRDEWAGRGYEWLKGRPMSGYLKPLVDAKSVFMPS